MAQDHWLHGFNHNVEEWLERERYETLACRQFAYAPAVFKAVIAAGYNAPVRRMAPVPPIDAS